jgi:hypothetical protein
MGALERHRQMLLVVVFMSVTLCCSPAASASHDVIAASRLSPGAGPESFKLSFGKYSGKRLWEVAAHDPGYVRWLVQAKCHQTRPALREALNKLGMLEGKGLTATPDIGSPVSPAIVSPLKQQLSPTACRVKRRLVDSPVAEGGAGAPKGRHAKTQRKESPPAEALAPAERNASFPRKRDFCARSAQSSPGPKSRGNTEGTSGCPAPVQSAPGPKDAAARVENAALDGARVDIAPGETDEGGVGAAPLEPAAKEFVDIAPGETDEGGVGAAPLEPAAKEFGAQVGGHREPLATKDQDEAQENSSTLASAAGQQSRAKKLDAAKVVGLEPRDKGAGDAAERRVRRTVITQYAKRRGVLRSMTGMAAHPAPPAPCPVHPTGQDLST